MKTTSKIVWNQNQRAESLPASEPSILREAFPRRQGNLERAERRNETCFQPFGLTGAQFYLNLTPTVYYV